MRVILIGDEEAVELGKEPGDEQMELVYLSRVVSLAVWEVDVCLARESSHQDWASCEDEQRWYGGSTITVEYFPCQACVLPLV